MSDIDLAQLLSRRRVPTAQSTYVPFTHLVAVADTNALAGRACNAAGTGREEDLFHGLSLTGRSNTFVGAHVPGELADHLVDVAAGRVHLASAERVLWGQIMPSVAVVDLPIRDHLHPRIRPILNADRSLPLGLRGDPDDIGTAALAEFLAPAVILSADSVFMRHGMSNATAASWVSTAYNLLRVAGVEATLADAATLAELAARATFSAGGAAYRLARRHPIPATMLIGAALIVAYCLGYFRVERIRNGLARLRNASEPLISIYSKMSVFYTAARSGIRVIEPYGPPTDEQRVARHLARRARPLTPSQLRDELKVSGHLTSAAGLKRIMSDHPAFVRAPGDLYGLGHIVGDSPEAE